MTEEEYEKRKMKNDFFELVAIVLMMAFGYIWYVFNPEQERAAKPKTERVEKE